MRLALLFSGFLVLSCDECGPAVLYKAKVQACYDSARDNVLVYGEQNATGGHKSVIICNLDVPSTFCVEFLSDSDGGFVLRLAGRVGDVLSVDVYDCDGSIGTSATLVVTTRCE